MISARVFHGQWSSPSLGARARAARGLFGAGDGVCYAFDAITSAASHPGYLRHIWSFDCNPPEHRFRGGKPIDYWEGDKRKDSGNHDDWTYLGPNEIIGTRCSTTTGSMWPWAAIRCTGCDQGRTVLHRRHADRRDRQERQNLVVRRHRPHAVDHLDRRRAAVCGRRVGPRLCLEADTGKLCWMHQTGADIWSSTLVADGKVYIGTRRHFCVLAAGRQKRLLAEVRLGSQVRSTPAVADGVLYVASQQYLWAVQLTKPHGLVSVPIQRRHADHRSHT